MKEKKKKKEKETKGANIEKEVKKAEKQEGQEKQEKRREKKEEKQEMQEKKEEKDEKNKKYGIFNNYCYLYRGFFRNSRWNILIVAMILVGSISAIYVNLYVPKVAVALVTEQVSVGRLVGTLCLMELLYFLLCALNSVGYTLVSNPGLKYKHVLEEKMLHKICRTAYSDLEDPDYKGKLQHAQELYLQWNRDARHCIWTSLHFVQLMATTIISSGIMILLHPAVLAVMAVGSWLEYQVDKMPLTWRKKHRDFWEPLDRKLGYIAGKMNSFACAKELRLYAADRWLLPKYTKLVKERRMWAKREKKQESFNYILSNFISVVRAAVVYGFLIWGVVTGKMKPDDFILYVGLALSLSNRMGWIAGAFRDLKEHELSITDYRKMLSVPDSRRRKPENMPEISEAPAITFSHVSYAYPGAEEDTLKDVDIHIRPGEKIALVGLNGAGKTTLIKLLCGMYEPAKGEILINGESSVKWDLEEWYKLFSVVFQDIGVFPATIAENVSSCAPEDTDRERVKKCLEQAGLLELVEGLPQGMDTYLQKEMFKEGVNLSGGETQKLLLARAIYKEAPVLVLDEPTAALDAIAENRLYLRYNELTKGRTSLFISHRLSSTRFCDRILMLEDGRIVEQGSHQELMEKKGVYYRLFQVQSHYYQKDRESEFTSDVDPEWEVSSYVSE